MNLETLQKEVQERLDYLEEPELPGEYLVDVAYTNTEWIAIYKKLLQVFKLARAAKSIDESYNLKTYDEHKDAIKEVFGDEN